MAEFLVLDINHVWDSVDIGVLVGIHGPEIEQKYNARIQRGDVIEVRPDGYWTGPNALPFKKEKLCVVSVPFVSYEQAMQYMDGEYTEDIMTKKRRYNVDTIQLTFDKNKIAVIKNIGQLNILLRDKSIG